MSLRMCLLLRELIVSGIKLKNVLCMPALENNLKLKNIFPSFFMKFRKGIVFSTFWSQKSISEKLFSKHDKSTAAVVNINSPSKDLEKNAFFIIKMESESHFKTIRHLTRFSAIY
jgi:hypothetical protein